MVVSAVDISEWISQIAGLRNSTSKLFLNFKWVDDCGSNAVVTVITATENALSIVFTTRIPKDAGR